MLGGCSCQVSGCESASGSIYIVKESRPESRTTEHRKGVPNGDIRRLGKLSKEQSVNTSVEKRLVGAH